MKRRSRLYEYTTSNYEKGYMFGKNITSIKKKLKKQNKKYRDISYYDLRMK